MTFHITHLSRQGDQNIRYGFDGKLIDIIKDYRLHSSQLVQASIFHRRSRLYSFDLRMHFRVKPAIDWAFRFSLESQPVNLINISLGGALFCRKDITRLEPGQTVQVTGQASDGEQLPPILSRRLSVCGHHWRQCRQAWNMLPSSSIQKMLILPENWGEKFFKFREDLYTRSNDYDLILINHIYFLFSLDYGPGN
jgi:hypothetical protein